MVFDPEKITLLVDGESGAPEDAQEPPAFDPLVPAGEAVAAQWFDEVAFVGDSVSVMLEQYNSSAAALGKATFLCSVSLSQQNALSYDTGSQRLPEYPKGSGQKPAIEDSVAATGAKVVYIMLGMDNIAYGIERATNDYLTIINNIVSKNPDVQIVIQSVTPMTETSTSTSEKLNNDQINAFNAKMQEYCQENRWYYLNVAEVFKDENGYLKLEYCSDRNSMGMHFTYDGAKVWVNYLKTHIPEDLL